MRKVRRQPEIAKCGHAVTLGRLRFNRDDEAPLDAGRGRPGGQR
jgi:hypothetical protein